jgi:spore coat polysaccharide biosynthesis protein SpsF
MPDAPQVVTVIQARTGSTRLPNKIMRPLLGKPVLARIVERVQAARLAGTVVVATTTDPADDVIAALCRAEGILCMRGHPTDLLDRHVQAGRQFEATAVVKIPSDVVLIDPGVIDTVLAVYLAQPDRYDYVSNLHPETYPDGNDVEIMAMATLETAWREASRSFEREHTTPYFWEQPERFRLANVRWETGLNYSVTHRWVLDYEEDYQLIEAIFETLYPTRPDFGLVDILALLEREPALKAINARYLGVNWYRDHLSELKTITPVEPGLIA